MGKRCGDPTSLAWGWIAARMVSDMTKVGAGGSGSRSAVEEELRISTGQRKESR
jgi:hypothetical protein